MATRAEQSFRAHKEHYEELQNLGSKLSEEVKSFVLENGKILEQFSDFSLLFNLVGYTIHSEICVIRNYPNLPRTNDSGAGVWNLYAVSPKHLEGNFKYERLASHRFNKLGNLFYGGRLYEDFNGTEIGAINEDSHIASNHLKGFISDASEEWPFEHSVMASNVSEKDTN